MSGRFRWWYHDAEGRAVFQHYRYPRRPTEDDPREKGYGYRVPTGVVNGRVQGWNNIKPPEADALLYRLPWVLANRDALLLSTEGERDVDAARGIGLLATSHHGGAGKFTVAQAESLAGHRGPIWLIADNDVAGAVDVTQRYDRLRAVGIPARRLRVWRVAPSHKGADLRDHIEAGYDLGDLRRADLDQLRELADQSTGDLCEGSWGHSAQDAEDIREWRRRLGRS